MAHPERQEWAKQLSQELQAPIVYDRCSNIWDTCRRAWLSQVSIGAEYTLVLQDDAIVCSNFRERAEKIIAAQTEDFIYSFYVGNLLAMRVRKAEQGGQDHVITNMIFNEVALCMKTEHIERMVKFCDDREAKNDQLITQWARIARIKIFHPLPGLVDHRDGDSIYRRVNNKPLSPTPRRAISFKQ